MTKSFIAVSADGQLHLPASAREELGIPEGGTVEIDVIDQAIVIRPVTDEMPTEDEIVRIKRGMADAAAGRVRQLTEEELLQLIEQA